MTIKEPQEEALLTDEATFAPAKVAPPSTGSQPPPGSGAPRRAPKPDYRLRGLDLDADAFVEATPRQVRKRHPTRLRRRRRLVLQWTVVLLLLAATAGFLRLSVIQPYAVRSTAMVPTLKPGTNVLVLRPTALRGSLKTGDLVVFHRPDGFSCSNAADSTNTYLKRVIGLPGQTIWSAAGRIYIDGRVLEDVRWYNRPFGDVGPSPIARTTIPAGSYFVLGDNRTDPCDSRAFGPIAGSSLIGKVLATTTHNGHPSVHLF